MGGGASVKVLDFGVSKTLANSSGGGSLTQTRSMLGSPLYMSPEQMVSSKHVDARCDVWALGIILYEFVTGAPPFVAETVTEIIAQILQLQAKPPNEVNGVNLELSQAILKCIEKDPAKRYQNVGELAGALSPFAPRAQRNTAERVSRVLGTPIAAFPTMLASQPPQRPAAIAATAAATNASWGQGGTTGSDTEVVTRPKSAGVKIAVVSVGLIAALAGASIVVLRKPAPPAVAAGLVAPADSAIAPSAIASAPTSLPAVASATPSAAPSAAPAAPPAAPNTTHKSSHGSPTPPPPKPAATTPPAAVPAPAPAPAPTEKKNPLQIDLK